MPKAIPTDNEIIIIIIIYYSATQNLGIYDKGKEQGTWTKIDDASE